MYLVRALGNMLGEVCVPCPRLVTGNHHFKLVPLPPLLGWAGAGVSSQAPTAGRLQGRTIFHRSHHYITNNNTTVDQDTDTAAVVTPSRLLDIHIQLQRYYR